MTQIENSFYKEQGELWTVPPGYALTFIPLKILERYPSISDDELFLVETWEYMKYLDKQGKDIIW